MPHPTDRSPYFTALNLQGPNKLWPTPGTQIIELADRLGIEVKDLVNQEHPIYKSRFERHDLSERDWIKMIQHNPDIMKQPIALRGNITILVETPTDIIII